MIQIIKTKIKRFLKWPFSLKMITSVIFLSIFGLLFTGDLPLEYTISAMYLCFSIIFLCYAIIAINPTYTLHFGYLFKKEKYNRILGIFLLIISVILILLTFLSWIVNIVDSQDNAICEPPKTLVGTICCVLSEKFKDSLCIEEEEQFKSKFREAFNKSIITDGSKLRNEGASFSFYPVTGYYIIEDVNMLGKHVAFYLIKPIKNSSSACEIKVAYRINVQDLSDFGNDRFVNSLIQEIEKNGIYSLKSRDVISTKFNDNGDSLTFTSTFKPTSKFSIFIDKSKLVMFHSIISSEVYQQQCISTYDQTVSTFQWED